MTEESNQENSSDHEIEKEIKEEWEEIVVSDSDHLENMEEIVKEGINERNHFKPLEWLFRIKRSFNRLLDNLTTLQRYAVSGGAVAAVSLGIVLGLFIAPSTNNSGGNEVVFKVSASNAQTVGLAGDFNAYKPIEMKDKNGDGVWKVHLPLEEGKYEYYYLIDGKKISGNYPMADEVVRDWKNRKNGIRFVREGESKEDSSNKHATSA